jgi:DNA-binding response OmpR family regulator
MSRVLVVDDSSVVRGFLQNYLSQDGHEVITANTGEDALEVISRQNVDLVFLDLLMPGMSGVDVLRTLSESPNRPPVIVLTADIQDTTRTEVMELGAAEFLSKPPAPEDVRRAARTHARSNA